MSDIKANRTEHAAEISENKAILSAFDFLADVTEQVESLRKTLIEQIKQSKHLEMLNITLEKFDEDYENSNSEWLTRSQIDTFEICYAKKNGRKVPDKNKVAIIYGAFQTSLAPIKESAKNAFFPHIAILLIGKADNKSGRWECEEFNLDEEYLREPKKEHGIKWEKAGDDGRWQGHDGFSVAFVVPLIDLCNDVDTGKKVVSPLFAEIKQLLVKIEDVQGAS